jgi:hypothetical protein
VLRNEGRQVDELRDLLDGGAVLDEVGPAPVATSTDVSSDVWLVTSHLAADGERRGRKRRFEPAPATTGGEPSRGAAGRERACRGPEPGGGSRRGPYLPRVAADPIKVCPGAADEHDAGRPL